MIYLLIIFSDFPSKKYFNERVFVSDDNCSLNYYFLIKKDYLIPLNKSSQQLHSPRNHLQPCSILSCVITNKVNLIKFINNHS